jgi:hypothetical protein
LREPFTVLGDAAKTMTTSAQDLQYCTPLKISRQPNTPWDEKYDANEEND